MRGNEFPFECRGDQTRSIGKISFLRRPCSAHMLSIRFIRFDPATLLRLTSRYHCAAGLLHIDVGHDLHGLGFAAAAAAACAVLPAIGHRLSARHFRIESNESIFTCIRIQPSATKPGRQRNGSVW